MAKARKRMPGERHEVPVMFYLTKPQKRGLDGAAERDAATVSVWVRRLVAAELSRLAVRDQLDR